ncbi:TonB-dependent receptor [Sphingomonas sp. PR090111-T3T-6A]|uniref:TonB-dependent receptor n=1 Tax=Sphingomonas sp. PR090111-T3T-6A TaxID=685778 RepID=UPI00039ABB94|nr:TonB-dependent receptor [Sphingomonas sp. PR090111-T3T-6A]
MIRRLLSTTVFPVILTATAGQAAPSPPADQTPSSVIVTAQRRDQRLGDVGLAMTVLPASKLLTQRVEGMADLARIVPGLSYTPSPNATPVYTLRGVGFYETSVAAYPDVTTYLDQAPLALPAFTTLTAFDLERVEVLKGPQGTLFGNNATGGAINFVAAKPQGHPEASIELGYGRFNRINAQGYVTGPIAPDLDARFAFRHSSADDWQKSISRDDRLGQINNWAGRLLLDWRPDDRLRFSLDINGWIDRSDPEAPQLARPVTPSDLQAAIGATGPTGTVTPDFPLLTAPAAPKDPRAADWDPQYRPFANNKLGQIALTSAWTLATDVQLTSITNYVAYRMFNATEGDGTALVDLDIIGDRAHAHSIFQELRLANLAEADRLHWVTGVSLDRTHVYERIDLRFPDASTGSIQGFSADRYDSNQRVRSEALFGNLEYRLTPRLTLKGGARYTWADRRTVNGSYQAPGYVEPFPGSPGITNLINTLWGTMLTPLFCPGQVFTPIAQGGSVSVDPATCRAGLFRASLNEHNASWRAGADYHLSHDLLLYANVAKGWKNGSFPTISAPVYDQYQPVTQESLLAYEAGLKGKLAGGVATFDASAFYYDYRDKQVRAKTVNPIFGILDQLVNVPRSHILGVDTSMTLTPARGLSAALAGTWLDTKVRRYDGIVSDVLVNGLLEPVRAPFRGAQLPFAPHWQGSVSVDYATALGQAYRGSIGVTLALQSKSYASLEKAPQNLADATLPGRTILDLRASIETVNGRWRLGLWGKNVTNRFYVTNAVRAYDTIIRYTGRPAEYGLTLAYHWR